MHARLNNASCQESSCVNPAIVSFAQQDFCLEHFVTHCYRRLDGLEQVVRSPLLESARVPSVRALLEECSNQTLLVSLRHESLTNLDRSRLLGILLQCGELQFMLRNRTVPGDAHTQLPFTASAGLPRERSAGQRAACITAKSLNN